MMMFFSIKYIYNALFLSSINVFSFSVCVFLWISTYENWNFVKRQLKFDKPRYLWPYHAHNIHHCSISNIGLGFCYTILKGKFLFIFYIFGGDNWKSINSLVTHNCALLSISARFGFFFVHTKKNFDHVRMLYCINDTAMKILSQHVFCK